MKGVVLLSIVCILYFKSASSDQIKLTGVVRDFWPCTNLDQCGQNGVSPKVSCDRSKCHPDFEINDKYLASEKGIVKKDLDANRKPVFSYAKNFKTFYATNGSLFDKWYNNQDGWNIASNFDLVLTNSDQNPNVYTYINGNFYPINGKGFGNYYQNRNYHFTFEVKSQFTYLGNETFDFTGDDDVWVFINNKLAIDIGGVHGQESARIVLNESEASLGIKKGNVYNFDFFFAERHTTESNLKISTSIALTCALDHCLVCQGDGQSCCKCNDKDACTTDTCNATTGACIYNKVNCDLGDKCKKYSCNSNAAAGTSPCSSTPVVCTPGACQTATCDSSVGCQYKDINCDDQNKCTTESCDVKTSKCVYKNVSCDDSDKCTTDTCSAAGGCSNERITCDDSDKCTRDSCNSTVGCVFEKINYDDGNLCTQDSCDKDRGVLNIDISAQCNDNDACTIDSCDPKIGCVNTRISCDDGNGCTEDTCDSRNGCSNRAYNCDDNNKCTNDKCNPLDTLGCLNENITIDDNDACTIDSCDPIKGISRAAVNCDDGKACTIDSCDRTRGCVNVPVATNFCDDKSECTIDSCSNSTGCVFEPRTCNDKNACTDDTCDKNKVGGCVFTNKTCNDESKCTRDSCDPASGCVFENVDCNDGDDCTRDSCDPSRGCVYEPIPCDRCKPSTGPAPNCSYTDACFPRHCNNTDGECVQDKIICDDKNPCTNDTCRSNNATSYTCVFTPVDCPTTDKCSPASCSGGNCINTPVKCDDNNKCTNDYCVTVGGEAKCQFDPIPIPGDTPCTPYVCNATTGVSTRVDAPCSNLNLCLQTICTVNGNKAECSYPAVPCPTVDPCFPTSCSEGQCVNSTYDCNDNNECTSDYCDVKDNKAVCRHEPITTNGQDACNPFSCNPATGEFTKLNTPCNDNNKCTIDSCRLENNTFACDFDPITCESESDCLPQTCDLDTGKCSVKPVVCDDNNWCTIDAPVVGADDKKCKCVFTPVKCDNSDLCRPQVCNASSSSIDTRCETKPVACDDNNICTEDKCVKGNCTFVPLTCDDNNECTVDTCDQTGKGCVNTDIKCDDNDQCTTDTCDNKVGCVFVTANVTQQTCKLSYCDKNLGVVVQDQVCRPSDRCKCVDNQCSCISFLQQYEKEAKISGGIIAAIVIGVVVFVVIAALGGKKSYDFYKASKDPALAVEDNPLYENANKDVENPLYETPGV